MRNLNTLGPVRTCTLFAGLAAALAAIWGLFNTPDAHSSPRAPMAIVSTQPGSETSDEMPSIEMPLVTVIGKRRTLVVDDNDGASAVQRQRDAHALESAAD